MTTDDDPRMGTGATSDDYDIYPMIPGRNEREVVILVKEAYQALITEIERLRAEIQALKSFDPMSDHDVACPCCGYKFGDLMQRNADLGAENQRLRDESDEWERKSKNNGLAAMIGLEYIQELEAKKQRFRAALEVYANKNNWRGLDGCHTILDVEPWITAQTALGLSEP